MRKVGLALAALGGALGGFAFTLSRLADTGGTARSPWLTSITFASGVLSTILLGNEVHRGATLRRKLKQLLSGGQRGGGRVVGPPGWRLDHIARFLWTTRGYERIFKPLLAEYQHEHFMALSEQRVWRARWLRILYLLVIARTLGLSWLVTAIKEGRRLIS